MYIDIRGLLYQVCLLVRACMWVFQDLLFFVFIFSHLILEWEMSDILLGALGHCPFYHYIHFLCDFHSVFWFELIIIPLYVFIVSPSSSLLLSIHPLHFSFCFFPYNDLFQVWYFLCIILIHLFISLICFIVSLLILYSHYAPSSSWLMRFSVHEGMGFDHWVFELSFPSYIHPITLAYVSSRVLRPP